MGPIRATAEATAGSKVEVTTGSGVVVEACVGVSVETTSAGVIASGSVGRVVGEGTGVHVAEGVGELAPQAAKRNTNKTNKKARRDIILLSDRLYHISALQSTP